MIKFPHISLFRNAQAYVEHVNTDPEVPDQYRVKNPVTWSGSIKLHGSNCGVVWDLTADTLTAQSRETVLTPTDDYKGFAKFVIEHETAIRAIVGTVLLATVTADQQPIKVAIYGEWVGKGVSRKNKGSAVSQFDPKHWALFAAAVLMEEDEEPIMVSHLLNDVHTGGRIGNVSKAGDWTLTIDFSDPASVEAGLLKAKLLTESFDRLCPYGTLHGLTGKGEGVVWMPTGEYHGREDLMWKHKSEAHSVVFEEKLKRERPVVPADVQAAISAFVEATVSTNRLEQGCDALAQQGKATTKRFTGDFIKWLTADVERECALQLADAGLEWGQVQQAVTTKGREYFLGVAA